MSIIPFASLLDEAPGQAGAAFVARAKRPLAAFLSGFGLFVILLTLQPFPILDTESDISLDTANIINQVGYLGLGGLYLGAMLALCDRQVLKTLLSPSWPSFSPSPSCPACNPGTRLPRRAALCSASWC